MLFASGHSESVHNVNNPDAYPIEALKMRHDSLSNLNDLDGQN